MSSFFINRPIFAIVIAILIMLAGAMSIVALPLEQYPDIAPPTVRISASYPGASSEAVENTVTQVIERELSGIDGLMYFTSDSGSDGGCSIELTFEQGADPDIAQVQTQNRIQQIGARLPSAVQQQGVTVTKAQTNILMLVALYDETDASTNHDVADYLMTNVQDRLSRLDGVGNVELFGDQYAIRIWMDPMRLRAFELMPSDLRDAVKRENRQASFGSLGGLPAPPGQNLTASLTAPGLLKTPAQFREIIVKYKADGSALRLGDVARVEMGSESYGTVSKLNQHPSAALSVNLASGANAIETSRNVRALMEEIVPTLPEGYGVVFANDNSDFVKKSLQELARTIIEAVLLVTIVMYVFLGSFRATVIPAVTLPVILLGTFGIIKAAGFSINTLTLFGLVLSVGLLVDDAIVVVENAERLLRTGNMSPREAAIESMREISGALTAITVIIMVVFLPIAFFSGSTGIIYRQFSITIISSMGLSLFMALTLTPAMCAVMLKDPGDHKTRFQRLFDKLLSRFDRRIRKTLARPARWLAAGVLITLGALMVLMRLPTGFLPNEDQGVLICLYSLPPGADMSRTSRVSHAVSSYFLKEEAGNVQSILTNDGFGFTSKRQNNGMAFITLNDWSIRKGRENSSDLIAGRAMMRLSQIKDAQIFVFNLLPIMGLGQTDGIEFYFLAASGTDRAALASILGDWLAKAASDPDLRNVRADSAYAVPQLSLAFNNAKAISQGLEENDIYDTLNVAMSGEYINDFIDRSRIKKVYLQAEPEFRSKPEDLMLWSVRSENGKMVAYSEFTKMSWVAAPELLERYNGVPAYYVQGSAAPGLSSGQAMEAVERSVAGLSGAQVAWSGLSDQERKASGQTVTLYSLSILVVFLCLAALYESWSVPAAVLPAIPLGVAGAVLAAYLRGLENNIFFQVAILTIIGLAARNAILMVEFADQARKSGMDAVEAARSSATLRLRPIVMTTLAFGAGILPLALSTGIGANSRVAIGTGALGGTLSSAFLIVFFIPVFFLLVTKLVGPKKKTS